MGFYDSVRFAVGTVRLIHCCEDGRGVRFGIVGLGCMFLLAAYFVTPDNRDN